MSNLVNLKILLLPISVKNVLRGQNEKKENVERHESAFVSLRSKK